MLRPHYRLGGNRSGFGGRLIDGGRWAVACAGECRDLDKPRSAFCAMQTEKPVGRIWDPRAGGAKVRRSCKLLILGYLAESCSQIFA
jgi:hypothetical protein